MDDYARDVLELNRRESIINLYRSCWTKGGNVHFHLLLLGSYLNAYAVRIAARIQRGHFHPTRFRWRTSRAPCIRLLAVQTSTHRQLGVDALRCRGVNDARATCARQTHHEIHVNGIVRVTALVRDGHDISCTRVGRNANTECVRANCSQAQAASLQHVRGDKDWHRRVFRQARGRRQCTAQRWRRIALSVLFRRCGRGTDERLTEGFSRRIGRTWTLRPVVASGAHLRAQNGRRCRRSTDTAVERFRHHWRSTRHGGHRRSRRGCILLVLPALCTEPRLLPCFSNVHDNTTWTWRARRCRRPGPCSWRLRRRPRCGRRPR